MHSLNRSEKEFNVRQARSPKSSQECSVTTSTHPTASKVLQGLGSVRA